MLRFCLRQVRQNVGEWKRKRLVKIEALLLSALIGVVETKYSGLYVQGDINGKEINEPKHIYVCKCVFLGGCFRSNDSCYIYP